MYSLPQLQQAAVLGLSARRVPEMDRMLALAALTGC